MGTVSEDAKLPILQQVTEIIVLEIQKTFDFFRATAAGEHIERIYLAGGSSKVPGSDRSIAAGIFAAASRYLNPFQQDRTLRRAGTVEFLDTECRSARGCSGIGPEEF